MDHDPNRAEAERLLGIAEKLLQSRDLSSSRDFAILAQETEPLLDGSDQILAVADVLLAADARVSPSHHHDWYAILQVDRRRSDDFDLIKKSYRRLALLLHPDKNKYAFAENAFKLVADAWAVLSDPARKPGFDRELGLFSRVDLAASAKLPVRRGGRGRNDAVSDELNQNQSHNNQQSRSRLTSFWTACPYCYILYEYPGVYENCCLRCQNCKRGFEAVEIPNVPPAAPGQEVYYCCWGFFPMGFVGGGGKGKGKASGSAAAFPNWMPPIFTTPPPAQQNNIAPERPIAAPVVNNGMWNVSSGTRTGQKKRGRPRKYA